MDTNDLKNLFNEQSGASRLTASGITRHVERQRSIRRAGVASFVSLAVVGASVGGLWLNSQRTDTLPAEPLPAPTITTPTQDPTTRTDGGPGAFIACTVEAPKAWVDALNSPLDPATADAPWIEKDETKLTWHHGTQAIPFADDAQLLTGAGITDGRYVVYWADSTDDQDGKAKVWDSQQPDAEPWALPGTFASDLPMQAFLDDGIIWFTQVDDVTQALEEQTTTVSRIDLSQGREATELLTVKGLTVGSPFDGGLQVREPGKSFALLKADGSQAELPAPFRDLRIADTSYDAAVLAPDGEGEWSLYTAEWGEARVLDGVWMLHGEWALTTGDAKYGEGTMLYNIRTGVRVVLPGQGYLLDNGYLSPIGISPDTRDLPVVELADLPPVSCDDAEPAVVETPEPEATTPATTARALAAGTECTVDAPEAWRQRIANADELQSVDANPWLQKDGSTLTWHQGNGTHVIDTHVDLMYGGGQTDGRYVMYLSDSGTKVWDSQNPTAAPFAIEGDFGGDNPGAGAKLAKGRIWLTELDDWDQPPADVTTTVSVIDLAKGTEPRQLLKEKDVTVAAPFLDGLQVRIGDGEYSILLADGGFESLPAAIKDKFISDTTMTPDGELALVTEAAQVEPNAKKWVYSDRSGDLVEIADARDLEGEWALTIQTLDMVDHFVMHNVFTGAAVELPWEDEQIYMLDGGYLWVPSEKFETYAPVALSELEEVSCPG